MPDSWKICFHLREAVSTYSFKIVINQIKNGRILNFEPLQPFI